MSINGKAYNRGNQTVGTYKQRRSRMYIHEADAYTSNQDPVNWLSGYADHVDRKHTCLIATDFGGVLAIRKPDRQPAELTLMIVMNRRTYWQNLLWETNDDRELELAAQRFAKMIHNEHKLVEAAANST
jgi:hypothetical protein